MSYQTRTEFGWFIIATPKQVGVEPGERTCPKNLCHNSRIHEGDTYCPVCGTKTVFDLDPVFGSFHHVYERAEHLTEKECKALEKAFCYVPVDFLLDEEYLCPTLPKLFSFVVDEDEGINVINPLKIPVDFQVQREKIEKKLKLLDKLYSKVELMFGTIAYEV